MAHKKHSIIYTYEMPSFNLRYVSIQIPLFVILPYAYPKIISTTI